MNRSPIKGVLGDDAREVAFADIARTLRELVRLRKQYSAFSP